MACLSLDGSVRSAIFSSGASMQVVINSHDRIIATVIIIGNVWMALETVNQNCTGISCPLTANNIFSSYIDGGPLK